MWWRRRPGLPEGWESLVEADVAHWRHLDDDERARLVADTDALLRTKRWEAAHGFDLTERIRVVIAAQAALLVNGLDLDAYREVSTIIVHPTRRTRSGVRPGPAAGVVTDDPVTLVGEAAHGRGPVTIAWDSALAAARHPRGFNVVFHEFAHKLDMLDHLVDGTPPLPDEAARQRWIDVCTAAYERVRAGGSRVLRPYAGVGPGEFFAVATEVFFDGPVALRDEEPELYEVLRDFYRQDPAGRCERSATH